MLLRLRNKIQLVHFFKHLDNTIALHQRKLNLLKQSKTNVYASMFPQNEENIPALRFVGFSEPWEQRTVKEVLKECEEMMEE